MTIIREKMTFSSFLSILKAKCRIGHKNDTIIQSGTSWFFSSKFTNAICKKKYDEYRLTINTILGKK